MLADSSGVLVVGSSVAVMSSYKIVLDALRADKPVAVMNGGPGRADARVLFVAHWRGGALEEMLTASISNLLIFGSNKKTLFI